MSIRCSDLSGFTRLFVIFQTVISWKRKAIIYSAESLRHTPMPERRSQEHSGRPTSRLCNRHESIQFLSHNTTVGRCRAVHPKITTKLLIVAVKKKKKTLVYFANKMAAGPVLFTFWLQDGTRGKACFSKLVVKFPKAKTEELILWGATTCSVNMERQSGDDSRRFGCRS